MFTVKTPMTRLGHTSPNIRFRVYSQNNGECKYEFCIKLKDITWNSFIKNLFGSHTFEEDQLPTIVLLGDKHKIVLRHTNIKQLIRDALPESSQTLTVKLLVPDFENYFASTTNSVGRNSPNENEIKRRKAEIGDFSEIFEKRVSFLTMDQLVQNSRHVRFQRVERDENALVELPARENITQLGELHVKRLNDGDLLKLLKDGASLILQTSDNEMVSMKFLNDQLPTFNETKCKYRKLNMAYECSDLKVPVVIDDEIKFLFNRDAEFIQNMKAMVSDVEKHHREHLIRLKKFHETMRKIKTGKETSSDPFTPKTISVTISSAPATDSPTARTVTSAPLAIASTSVATASAPVATASPPVATASPPVAAASPPVAAASPPVAAASPPVATASPPVATASAPAADTSVSPTSEGSSNEGAQIGPKVLRRPHRTALKRTKRCLAAAALANASILSAAALTNDDLVSSADNPNGGRSPVFSNRRPDIEKMLRDLSLSSFPSELSFRNDNSNMAQQSVKPGTSKNSAVDEQQEIMPDAPAWFGQLLDKFKNEVLQEVKNLVKDVLDTSLPTSSASDMKTGRVPNQDDDQYLNKLLDGSPSSSAGKHKHHDKHHHGSGSSKRKSGALCSKRGGGVLGGAENKATTPYANSEKILELSSGLFVYSKSGFKVRMPRNASLTIQINIGKFAKYRNSLEDTDLRVQLVSNSIECCVKRASPATGTGKSAPMTKDLAIYYDVRIKSKDKSGKFRLYFNVISGGRIIGYAFKIDVRVKKEFTLPFGNSEGTLNYENEAFPIPMVESMMQMASTSGTNFIESPKSPVQAAKEEISHAAAATAAELADEGIGGNQEDFFSPTSDSEYSDMSDSKPDALLKDEGIDTCYRSVIETVTTAAPKCEHPDLDSESDTDSSISFLMDENEARDDLNDSLDVIQLPSCFIPNIECTDDVLPVRIKRKSSSATKRTVPEKDDSDSHQQWPNNKPSAFDTSTLTPVAVATSAPSPNVAFTKRTTPSPTPAVTISDDEEDEDVEFLHESIKSAAADHAYHRSLYPNLQGLKECVRPTTSNAAATNAGPSTASSNPKPPVSNPESPKQQPASEPYPHILPEKLFEMWRNAGPLPKQMQDTVTSVFTSVSNEINNAAIAARSAAASAAAAAASIVPNVPMPPSPTAPSTWTSSAAPAAAAAQSAADATPFTSNDESRSSHSQPPEEKRQKNVAFSFGQQTEPQQQKPNFTFEPQQQQQQQQRGSQTEDAEFINSLYKNLSEEMQNNLIILHDMGFTDDPYMIYLLEQFPNDLSKVIELLINYSTC